MIPICSRVLRLINQGLGPQHRRRGQALQDPQHGQWWILYHSQDLFHLAEGTCPASPPCVHPLATTFLFPFGSRFSVWILFTSLPSCCPMQCRRLRWLMHKAGEAVPVEGTAEALVAGRVGDTQRVPQAAAEARSGTVRRSLDGWVAPNKLFRKWMWGPISLTRGHRETKHDSHSIPLLSLKWTSLECGKSCYTTWYASLNSELSYKLSSGHLNFKLLFSLNSCSFV